MDQSTASNLRAATSTQFVIFNLFGDYIMPRSGAIWTHNLLQLLALLGIGERAARSTLSRMKQKGWLKTEKQGRHTRHLLTGRGQSILEQGNQRIFEAPFDTWDGQWRLVVYSLPEEKRDLRNELRKKLMWYGFGNLAPGTWISPHDWHAELEPILEDLGVKNYVNLFTAHYDGDTSDAALVRRCWDIPTLEKEYTAFVAHYAPKYERLCAQIATEGYGILAPEEYFVRRFWLTYDFQPFPRKDPNLPRVLLPELWVGHTARELFRNYRQLLSQGLSTFLDLMITNGDNTALSYSTHS